MRRNKQHAAIEKKIFDLFSSEVTGMTKEETGQLIDQLAISLITAIEMRDNGDMQRVYREALKLASEIREDDESGKLIIGGRINPRLRVIK